ncbi:MAG: SHOCT domain-containing protein [Thermoguttaceae bacterium]|nr:SHOCT domain-containing protein [Thermoguttaceae bacterium]
MPNGFVYDAQGNKRGPISSAQLKKLADTQKISRETIIENEAGRQAKAERVKGLFTVSVINPHVPPVNITATEQSPPVQQVKPSDLPDDKSPANKISDSIFTSIVEGLDDKALTNDNSYSKEATAITARNFTHTYSQPFWKKFTFFTIRYFGYLWPVFLLLSLPIAIQSDSDIVVLCFATLSCITPFVLIAWIAIKRIFEKRTLLREYQISLDELITNPNDPQLRRIALEKGRKLIKRRLLSETSLTQDIDVACAGATIGEGNAHKVKIKTSSSTVAQEIDELFHLCRSGLISAEEFEIGKNNILGNDMIDSKARELKMLHDLKEKGTLSQSEFNMKKWEILSRK